MAGPEDRQMLSTWGLCDQARGEDRCRAPKHQKKWGLGGEGGGGGEGVVGRGDGAGVMFRRKERTASCTTNTALLSRTEHW